MSRRLASAVATLRTMRGVIERMISVFILFELLFENSRPSTGI